MKEPMTTKELNSPFFWKITGLPIYLLGTFHVGPPGGFQLPQFFWSTFDSVDFLASERSDVPSGDSAMFRGPGASLADELSPELYRRFRAHADFLPAYESLALPAIALMLSVPSYSRLGLNLLSGLDRLLLARARQMQKHVVSLNPAGVLAKLQTVPSAVWREMILEALSDERSLDKRANEMTVAFCEGSEDTMAKLRGEDYKKFGVASEVLFDSQERQWLQKVSLAVDQQRSMLLAAGVLHFPGNGFIAKLQEAGFQIERVSAQATE